MWSSFYIVQTISANYATTLSIHSTYPIALFHGVAILVVCTLFRTYLSTTASASGSATELSFVSYLKHNPCVASPSPSNSNTILFGGGAVFGFTSRITKQEAAFLALCLGPERERRTGVRGAKKAANESPIPASSDYGVISSLLIPPRIKSHLWTISISEYATPALVMHSLRWV